MKLLEKLLVATDFSPQSEHLLSTAERVATAFGSQVVLLHAIPDLPESTLTLDMIRDGARRELKAMGDRLAERDLHAEILVVESGAPSVHIAEQADLNDVNVILVGAGEEGGTDRRNLGSTAAKVIRKANKPVWVVHPDKPAVNNILCPVDFGEPSRRALRNAIHLARTFDAGLMILHVAEPVAGFYRRFLQSDDAGGESLLERHSALFESFIRDVDLHNVQWTHQIVLGRPHEVIAEMARRFDVDLLVMGAVGQASHPRVQIGGVTDRLLRDLPCSLVTVRAEDAIQVRLAFELADMQVHFRQGQELLERGLPQEAIQQFHHCLDHDVLFAPAWDGLAAAYQRLNRPHEASRCADKAEDIRRQLWQRQVEMDVRSKHELFGKSTKSI